MTNLNAEPGGLQQRTKTCPNLMRNKEKFSYMLMHSAKSTENMNIQTLTALSIKPISKSNTLKLIHSSHSEINDQLIEEPEVNQLNDSIVKIDQLEEEKKRIR